MHCPYCVSAIADEAVVCPTCRRDVYLVRQLLDKVAALEAQLAAQSVAPESSTASVSAEHAEAFEVADEPVAAPALDKALMVWLMPVVLLLAAHWLMIFVYDTKVLYLRLLAMVLPLPFGLLFARATRWPFGWSLVPAIAMAALSVFAMSALTGWLDGVPVLPQNMVEVREFIEFALSIGFSFTTGLWLQQWIERRAEQRARQAAEQRRLGAKALAHGQALADSLSRLNDIGSAVVAFVTTAFSIYTGLKGILT